MAAGASLVETAVFLSLMDSSLSLPPGSRTTRLSANLCGNPRLTNCFIDQTEEISHRVTHRPAGGTMIPAIPAREKRLMGILDTIQQLAGQAGDAAQGDQAKVAGGFIQALTTHPEGIQGVLESLK